MSIAMDVYHWVDLVWAAVVVLTVWTARQWSTSSLVSTFTDRKRLWLVGCALLAALVSSYFARWYAMGFYGPQRANAISHTIFLAITVIASIHVATAGWRESLARFTKARHIVVYAVALSAGSVAANLNELAIDVSGLGAHRNYYRSTFALARQSAGRAVEVPAEPRLLLLRWKCVLTQDPSCYTNSGFARYFGLTSVVAIDAERPERECGGVQAGNR
jgi:hypothetical protein